MYEKPFPVIPCPVQESRRCEICSVQIQLKLLFPYMYFSTDSFFSIICINVNKLESHSQNEKICNYLNLKQESLGGNLKKYMKEDYIEMRMTISSG